MATFAVREEFSGSRHLIKKITITGVNDSAEHVVVEAAEAVAPNDRAADGTAIGGVFGDVVLWEAVWNMNDGYDNIKLYWEDEANDLQILTMHGDGSYSAAGFGGITPRTLADEGNAAVDEDMEVKLDVTEDGAENAGSSADITLVFKLKDR